MTTSNYARESHALAIGEALSNGLIVHREIVPIAETADWIDVITVLNDWARDVLPVNATAITWQDPVRNERFKTFVGSRVFITTRVSARLAS